MLNILGRKKDPQAAYVASERLDGKYVKRSSPDRGNFSPQNVQNVYHSRRAIPEIDISETYFVKESNFRQAPLESRNSKGKKKLPFLVRKKKSPSIHDNSRKPTDDIGLSYDEEGCDDIVAYSELMPLEESPALSERKLNPVVLSQLPTLKINDRQYLQNDSVSERLRYIMGNYRQPPAYPGHTSIDSRPSILQQLLQEQASLHLKDNASMINYMQVDLPSGLSNEDLTKILRSFPDDNSQVEGIESKMTPHLSQEYKDRLVLRTQDSVLKQPAHMKVDSGPISPTQLFEQRQKYYREHYSVGSFGNVPVHRDGKRLGKALSEFYPRDYDVHGPLEDYDTEHKMSLFDFDLASYSDDKESQYSMSDYMKSDLPSRYLSEEPGHELGLLQRRRSQTYVPPSPYLNAEVPEWLQVYAKASPELDDYLKWDMFRYNELDCWQTMLKKLYKKELEQIVMWFEEYRQALAKELENRRRELGMPPIKQSPHKVVDPRMRKTDV